MKKRKSIKTKTPTPEYDSQRETRVMFEELNKGIKTIAEGHSALSKKIEEMDMTLRKLDSNSFKTEWGVQSIKSQVGTIDVKLDRVEKELETVKTAVMENSRDIKVLKTDGKELKKGQDEIKQKLDTVTENHERRIQKLETVH